MYVRRKVVKGHTYFQVVEGYRDTQRKVRHRTVASLGRHATPQAAADAAEKERRRARALLRKAERLLVEYPPAIAEAEGLRRRIDLLTQRIEKLAAVGGLLAVDTTRRP